MPNNAGADTETIERFLDSTLESVDTAEALVLEMAGKAGFDEDALHQIGMAMREAVVNAVSHGNRYSAHKKVHLKAQRSAEGIKVVIADQGEGFDLEELPDPLAPENLLRNSGRGIFLVRAFMDEFQMRRLPEAGTEVTLVKLLASAQE